MKLTLPPLLDLGYHLHTLFLFTKADIRTALLPQTFFSLAAAPICRASRIIHVVAWIWLHLLMCNIANQIKAPDEDKINKPSRPLPMGRITLYNARIVRWALVPVCLAVSATYSAQLLATSFELQVLTVLYSEFHADEEWFLKNSLTAMMYGCAGLGGTLLAGCDCSHVSQIARLAIQLSIAAFASTLHAQDFKDVAGDLLTGRRTLPMLFPVASRISIALGIPLWSICLSFVWDLDHLTAAAFVMYSCFTGAHFILYQTVEADRRSCKLYSLWLIIHHVLPAYWHIFISAAVNRGLPSFEGHLQS
ncbi:hypothetical protein HYDPIDRAFT_111982 [Hydnomerulius pinastri MD-312]|uniref:Uncharacterized protein n=1 Tax=Hydnomerulius pinastri MD-312 TaxID=994086 RepID=A0A0C9W184_9AGAM|nr:hypothetical protein HYDPIDRAFT_111982 [Hydnomerulius pinastri MD-312]